MANAIEIRVVNSKTSGTDNKSMQSSDNKSVGLINSIDNQIKALSQQIKVATTREEVQRLNAQQQQLIEEKKGYLSSNNWLSKIGEGIKGLGITLGIVGIAVIAFSEAVKPIIALLKYFGFILLSPLLDAVISIANFLVPKKGDNKDAVGELFAKTVLGRSPDYVTSHPPGSDNPLIVGQYEAGTPYGIGISGESFKELLGNAFSGIKTWVDSGGFSEAFDSVVKWFSNVGQDIWDNGVLKFVNWISNVGQDIWDNGVLKFVNWISNVGQDIWDNGVLKFVNWISNVGQDIWDNGVIWVSEWFSNLGQSIWDNGVIRVAEWFSDLGQDIWDNGVIKIAKWFSNLGQSIWDNGVVKVAEWFADLPGKLWRLATGQGKAYGGTVATDGMYYLHAGETVNTKSAVTAGNGGGGNTFNITISGSYNTDELIRKLTSEISRRVGR